MTNNNQDFFDFTRLTNENFWKEIAHNLIQSFIYTIRKFWFLYILTITIGLVFAEILYNFQIEKYHLSMTLRYGSINNGLSRLNTGNYGGGGGGGPLGIDRGSLGAVESFGANFSGPPNSADTENNFGFNLKDFLIVINGKFVQSESLMDKLRNKNAMITSFSAKSSSSLATLSVVGSNRQEVLDKAKKFSDYLEKIFEDRKAVIIEKIDERLSFSKEEYRLISDQIKHVEKLEKDFGRTAEIISAKNRLLTQELSLRASLSEILSFKGENYIKDFQILSLNISSVPEKYLSRMFVFILMSVLTLILTSFGIILLVFFRLKKITEEASIKISSDNTKKDENQIAKNENSVDLFGKDSHLSENELVQNKNVINEKTSTIKLSNEQIIQDNIGILPVDPQNNSIVQTKNIKKSFYKDDES